MTETNIIFSFLFGIGIHIAIRLAYPWEEKNQRFFWLITMAIFAISIFILPSIIKNNSNFSRMLSYLTAGLFVSEYLRIRFKDKLEKLKSKPKSRKNLKLEESRFQIDQNGRIRPKTHKKKTS